MKTSTAALLISGLLLTHIHAGELTLDGASLSLAQADAVEAVATTTGTPGFGLDHGGQDRAWVSKAPGMQTRQTTNGTPGTVVLEDWSRTKAWQTPGWPDGGTPRAGGLAAWPGVGLFVGLLAALGWVCVAGVKQNAVSAEPWTPGGGVYREDRVKRVKMRPFKG